MQQLYALSFDDILLRPVPFSEVKSRADVDTSEILCSKKYGMPIIASNMTAVYSPELAREVARNGGISIVHRFCDIEENIKLFQDGFYTEEGRSECIKPWVSVGVSTDEAERADALVCSGAEVILIDVALGAAAHVVNQYNRLRELFRENIKIAVGNFATAEQIRAFASRCRNSQVPDLFKLNIGSGCFVSGTRVLMSDGSYKNIEDIKVHDRVINKNGKVVNVVGVKYSGMKDVIRYRTNNFHTESYATPDHDHWVADFSSTPVLGETGSRRITLDKLDRYDNSKFKWKQLQDTENSFMLLPKNIDFELPETFKLDMDKYYQSHQSFIEKIETSIITPSYDLGYIFGTFLGDDRSRIASYSRADGSRNASGCAQWYFGLNELGIADKLTGCVNRVFNAVATIRTKNINAVTLHNNAISRLLLGFGKRDKKHLPQEFFCSDKKYILGLFDGLNDSGGGYCNDERISFTNTSKQLIEQYGLINYLLNGYFPSVQLRQPTAGGLVGCNIENCKTSYVSRTLKTPENNQTKNYQLVEVFDKERYNIMVPTYDIEVDDDTNSFIANNVAVHNSACTTRVVTGVGLPSVTTILECVKTGYPIVQDGGIKTSGDFCKALALGCKGAIAGRLFSQCEESGAITVYDNDNPSKGKKSYRGSASESSYKLQGKNAGHRTPEGEEYTVPITGKVEDIMKKMNGGLRSSMSYLGSFNLNEYRKNCEIVVVTNSSIRENNAHGKEST